MSEGIPTYAWRMAPAHLRTRRQLAAEGLRPNGQDIAGRIPFHRRGREQVAHLFDVGKAAPKRPATAAQLAALAKATREHQLRAAERHGVDRAEFDEAPGDPGPGWTTSTSALAGCTGNALADALARNTEREGMER
ncbi:RRQRL motif-containing zinc-binding protein [Nocardia xishanensis]|uniref:RRQRL motif-containing zinc-binding protein n=1 Tax=Nocardia xishanensis TaxID=238964 RepID=UPI000A41F3AD|nr:RRQRL motif-containing zinc-binding protein [Nocardia xishanensis]